MIYNGGNYKTFSNKLRALVYIMCCYRNNNVIEDFHSSGKLKADSLGLILNDMNKASRAYWKQLGLVLNIMAENPRSDVDVSALGFSKFDTCAVEFIMNITGTAVQEWDPPHRVKINYTGDINKCILDGKVKDYCKNEHTLYDTDMKELNKDAYNRAYTLVLDGVL